MLDNTLTADGINIFADNAKKDDAEALVVRAGCTLVVRTEPFGQRGYSRAFVAEKARVFLCIPLCSKLSNLGFVH